MAIRREQDHRREEEKDRRTLRFSWFYSGYDVCEGAPPIVEVEWWSRTSQEELTVESEAVTGREP